MDGTAVVLLVMLLVVAFIILLIMQGVKYATMWPRQTKNVAQPEEREEKNSTKGTGATTFVEATSGGWNDVPESVAIDGGSQADYVTTQLRAAQSYAQKNVEVGERFDFTITNIPAVISPHEIMFGIMMQADKYGLECGPAMNERFTFVRTA